jgi:hypothetical protein
VELAYGKLVFVRLALNHQPYAAYVVQVHDTLTVRFGRQLLHQRVDVLFPYFINPVHFFGLSVSGFFSNLKDLRCNGVGPYWASAA